MLQIFSKMADNNPAQSFPSKMRFAKCNIFKSGWCKLKYGGQSPVFPGDASCSKTRERKQAAEDPYSDPLKLLKAIKGNI